MITRIQGGPSRVKVSTPWKPHSYQKKAIKFLLEHAAGALFLDPGLGKTAITLAAIRILMNEGLVNKVLLIAPLRVCYSVWPKEIQKWAEFNDLTVSIMHGPKKDQALKADADIYIINPEGLEWLLKPYHLGAVGKARYAVDLSSWQRLGFDMLVVDELSKLKSISTHRFKLLKPILGTFQRRWGLTGSPAANGLLDLFGQCYVLDQGRTLGQYISHYREQYFLPDYNGYSWRLKDGSEQAIHERLAPLALRLAAEDCLNMPELVTNNIYVDLPPKVFEFYAKLEDDLIAKLDDKTFVVTNAAAASIKCRQVANGGIYIDADVTKLVKAPKSAREWLNLHTAKIDALAEIIEELQGNPLLVAYDFEHDLDRLRELLGKDVPYIGGKVTAKRSAELEKLWNAGKLPVLLGHPQAMAHGLNLQEVGHHVCWHSLTWNYELYDQFIRRVLRQGNQHKRVMVHHLIARDTVDEAVLAAVGRKRKGQNTLFEALKNLRK